MIKKDSYTWKIYGLVVVVLCIVPAFLHAQEKDFTTWASAGFKYKVKPAFTLSGKLEWRTKDDWVRQTAGDWMWVEPILCFLF